MRKFYYCLLMMALAIVACTTNDAESDTASLGMNDMPQTDGPWMGSFDIDWVVDYQVVDTATLTVDGQFYMSHFPLVYIQSLLFKQGTQTTGYTGDKGDKGESHAIDFRLDNPQQTAVIESHITGYSTNAVYFNSTSSWTNFDSPGSDTPDSSGTPPSIHMVANASQTLYQISVDGQVYYVILYFTPNQSISMFDVSADAWTGTFPVDSIAVRNQPGLYTYVPTKTLLVETFTPQLSLTFNSTKRKDTRASGD